MINYFWLFLIFLGKIVDVSYNIIICFNSLLKCDVKWNYIYKDFHYMYVLNLILKI